MGLLTDVCRELSVKAAQTDHAFFCMPGILTMSRGGQVVEDGICKCKGFQGKCAEDEKYNRLLYVTKECEYYPDVERVINDSDRIFLIIFTLELACKVAARGFIVHPHAYLRESVNWLDFIVVVTGLLSAVSDAIQSEDLGGLAFFDVLRLMRVFRPLRFDDPAVFASWCCRQHDDDMF